MDEIPNIVTFVSFSDDSTDQIEVLALDSDTCWNINLVWERIGLITTGCERTIAVISKRALHPFAHPKQVCNNCRNLKV